MDDKRIAPRSRTFLKAEIALNGAGSALECIIRDMSDTGARLTLSEGVPLPDRLKIFIPKQARKIEAFVRWRRGDSVGIRFLMEEEPHKPQDDDELAQKFKQLEAENKRLRLLLEAIRADPGRIQELLAIAA